jgi:hypothetical protein
MKNAEIVKNLPQLKALKYELNALKAQIKGLEKQQRRLEQDIDVLERVTEIFEGVALDIEEDAYAYGKHLTVSVVDDSWRRYAEVYPNTQTNGQDWGLKLRSYGQSSGGGVDDWRGTDWGYTDAVLVAKRWAAHGTRTTDDFEIMCKVRHKLDPHNRTQKRRRAAFEAAWIAGHRELAGELLVGQKKVKLVTAALLLPSGAP